MIAGIRHFLVSLGVGILLIPVASAQNFGFEGGAVAGGGGTSTDSRFRLEGAIGEAWVGRTTTATNQISVELGFYAGETPRHLPSAPILRAMHSGQGMVLSWTATQSRYVLQEATQPGGGFWSDVPVVPLLDSGQWTAALEISGGKFFRLKSAAPVLDISREGTLLKLSWVSPDPRFVLQENSQDLNLIGWRDVATAVRPDADHWVVRVPLTSRAATYRLVSR